MTRSSALNFSPIFYDFRRTLRSKPALIAIAVVILLCLIVANNDSSANRQAILGSNHIYDVAYLNSGGYHFLTYASDPFGAPVSGVYSQFNLSNSQSGQNYSVSGTTNSSGLSLLTIGAPISSNYLASFLPHDCNSRCFPEPFPIKNLSLDGGPVSYPGSIFSTVVDSSNISRSLLQVFYVGSNGTLPDNYKTYYKITNDSPPQNVTNKISAASFPYSESNMTFLGTLSKPDQIFRIPFPSSISSLATVNVEIFASNGTFIYGEALPISAYNPNFGIESISEEAISIFSGYLGFLIPLVVIMGSFSSYGRDRVTGVLESVMSKPVTRRGLVFSRYLATVLGMTLATSIAIALVDVIFGYFFSDAYLSPLFLSSTFGALFVEVGAFAGLTFLVSHLVRSTGALIGLSIGLFILFLFFWSSISSALMLAAGLAPFSDGGIHLQIALDFLNPLEYTTLVYSFLTQTFLTDPITSAQYGLNVISLVVAGILWVALPLYACLRLAAKRD
ncbi:MAG: ABC transporter permease [Nitrososphaerales archaeon]